MVVIAKIQIVCWIVILVLLTAQKLYGPERPPRPISTPIDALGMGVVAVMIGVAGVGAMTWLLEVLAR